MMNEFDKVIDAGNGYQYVYRQQPDGSAGVEYFLQGRPITNTQFRAGTGQDTDVIEGTPPETNANDPYNNPIAIGDMAQQQTSGGGSYGSSGAAYSEPIPEPVWQQYFDGQLYSGEEGRISLVNAVTSKANIDYEKAVENIQKSYNYGLIDAGQRDDLITKNHKNALQSISSRYSLISPDAFQSNQMSVENEANQEFNTNKANNNLYKDTLQSEYANKLDTNQNSFQSQIDSTVNGANETLQPGSYANSIDLKTPELSNNVGTAYGAVSSTATGGDTAAIKTKIDNLSVDQDIKTYLYGKYGIK